MRLRATGCEMRAEGPCDRQPQDHDGSHIKGLIMNYLHHFFPSLLKVPGFLLEFITPIVKATKGAKSLAFYTLPEYDAWKESLGHNLRGWSIKYYKGLGTSTAKEAKDYFANLGEAQRVWRGTAGHAWERPGVGRDPAHDGAHASPVGARRRAREGVHVV